MDTIKQQLLIAIDKMKECGFHQEATYLEKYMQQFHYRYLPLFKHWDKDEEVWVELLEDEQEAKPELDSIDEALYDGTYNKQHDSELLDYHEAAKPMKLAMKWHVEKTSFSAYFWLEDNAIRTIFDIYYGIHTDAKTDFIIHIDPKSNKYQLSLYRDGAIEPQIIPEDAYQLLVFKNKLEHFRSDNYNQPQGAWVW